MRIFHLARRPPQWLRALLAGLLLAFAASTIAHASHRHEGTPASATHSLSCGHCVSFGSLADAPRHSYAAPRVAPTRIQLTAGSEAPISERPQTSAQPRAPPVP
jgi:hypothetical protein